MTWKKISKILFWIAFSSVTILVIFYGRKVLYQYQQTAVWKNTKLEGTLNNIPPELSKNFITADQVDDLEVWKKLEEELKIIQQQKMIPLENVQQLEDLYQQALASKKRQRITNGEIATQIELLRIYLDITIFEATAYENPEPSKLSNLYHRMEYVMLENNSELNRAYLEELATIIKDYNSLEQFINNTLPLMGEVSANTVIVNRKLTSVDTNSILNQIKTMHLIKFPNIKKLNILLMSGDWINAITLNEMANEYDQWNMQKQIMQTLTQNDYIDISTITTYQKALEAGIRVDIYSRESEEIAMNSPVIEIKYNGKTVVPGEYILKGTPLIARINPVYEAKSSETRESESSTKDRGNTETSSETTETNDTTETTTTTDSSSTSTTTSSS